MDISTRSTWLSRAILLVLLVIATLTIETSSRLTTVTKFDDYLKVIGSTTKFKEKLRIAEAVWGQLRVDYSKDLKKITKLYKQLPHFSIDDDDEVEISNSQEQAAAELKGLIRHYLRQRHTSLLANALSGSQQFNDSTEFSNHYADLLKDHDIEFINDVFYDAIDEVYNHKSTEILATQLLGLYQSDDILSFQLMVNVELHLFRRFMKRGDVNDIYLFNVSYYLYKILNDAYYWQLDKVTQWRIERAVAQLPSTMYHLLFTTNFCLINQGYNGYFYTSENILLDTTTRAVFSRSNTGVSRYAEWSRQIIEYNNDTMPEHNSTQIQLGFQFFGSVLGRYVFMQPFAQTFENVVGVWEAGGIPPFNGDWMLHLVENSLIFQQEEMYMCANATLYDSLQRLVHGYVIGKEVTSNSLACRWTVEPCPF